jgi:uncharacterized protein YndB with AHSA1/START domain
VTDPSWVTQEVRVGARPERVFAFFTDPEKMVRWMGSTAEIDPRPGGAYRLDINPGYVARGEFVELVPFSRIVFTWGWEGEQQIVRPGGSTVEVTFTPDGEGTLVRLVHRDLPTPEARSEHAKGWAFFLPRLAAASSTDP